MIENLFFALFGLTLFLCALTALDREEMAWPSLAFVMWLVLAAGIWYIEKPISFLNSTGEVVESIITYSGGFLTYLFIAMAFGFLFIVWNRIGEAWKESLKK